jgi:tetratricopeptide (TPR) repeat protein
LCQENEKARAQFERAIELFPEEIEPHLRLVDFCAGTGELKPLAKKYEKAISEQPRLAALRTALALIYSRQGRLDEAIQHGLEGSRLASGQELALRILAEVQLARATSLLRTNWDGAWLAFEDCAATLGQLTNLDSDQSAQWLEYAGRSFESFAEQSHRTNPPLPGGMDAQEVLALITAMRYYEKAGEQDPLRGVGRNAERVFQTISVLGQPKQLNIVADHLISGGFQADAMLVLTLSLRQDPDQAGAHHQLARLFTLTGPTGEMKQAVQHAKRAVEIEPNNSAFKQTLRFIQKVVDGLDRT